MIDCRGKANEHVRVRVGDLDTMKREQYQREYEVDTSVIHPKFNKCKHNYLIKHMKWKERNKKNEMN